MPLMQAANTTPTSRIPNLFTTRLPLMWFALAFLAGIMLGKLVSLSVSAWLTLAALALVLLILSRLFASRVPPSPYPLSTLIPFIFLLLIGLFLGALRYQM